MRHGNRALGVVAGVLVLGALVLTLLWQSTTVAPIAPSPADATATEPDTHRVDTRPRVERHSEEPTDASVTDERWVANGVVLDREGVPAGSGIRVDVRRSDRSQEIVGTTSTRSDGFWRLTLDETDVGATERLAAIARDPESRDESALTPVIAAVPGGDAFTLLRLRGTATVRGHVVSADGERIAGAGVHLEIERATNVILGWNYGETRAQRLKLESGPDGTFSASVRRAAGRGSVAAYDARGHLGPRVEFELDSGETDVGSVRMPSGESCEWRLRIVDAQTGDPVEAAVLKLQLPDLISQEVHAGFRATAGGVLSGHDGEIHLALPVRPDPVVIAVGSPDHTVAGFTLDCSTTSENSETLRLRRRSRARIRLTGSAAPSFAAGGGALQLRPAPETSRGGWDATTTDLRSGQPVSKGALRAMMTGYRHPAIPLERRVSRGSVVRVSPNEFDVRVAEAGGYDLVLEAGAQSVARTQVTIDADDDQVIELELPPGRLVTLDRTALLDWARTEDGAGQWFSRFAAWALPTSDDGIVPSVVTLLTGRETESVASTLTLWVPGASAGVGFGFVEEAGRGGYGVVQQEARIELPEGDAATPSLDVPVPIRSAAAARRVEISLERAGAPVQVAGIVVEISRRHGAPGTDTRAEPGDPDGQGGCLTNDRGVAVGRFFDGLYAVAPSSSVAKRSPLVSSWHHVPVDGPGETIRVVLPLEFAGSD